MIIVIATLVIKPGSLEALLQHGLRPDEILVPVPLHGRRLVSVTDPTRLVFVEKWERREDLTAHSKQPHLAVWREASGPHLVSRAIEVVHVEKVETF
jgi:quinol monooxygenase YgiN